MSVSIPILGSARRTPPGPRVSVQDAHPSNGRSIKYAAIVAAGVALFGLLSPANATPQLNASSSSSSVSAASRAADDGRYLQSSRSEQGPRSEQDSAKDLTSHLPWLAPVGHRQPRVADIPADKPPTALERAQERLNVQLDQKLIICRGRC
jgi:hypothetical protein